MKGDYHTFLIFFYIGFLTATSSIFTGVSDDFIPDPIIEIKHDWDSVHSE